MFVGIQCVVSFQYIYICVYMLNAKWWAKDIDASVNYWCVSEINEWMSVNVRARVYVNVYLCVLGWSICARVRSTFNTMFSFPFKYSSFSTNDCIFNNNETNKQFYHIFLFLRELIKICLNELILFQKKNKINTTILFNENDSSKDILNHNVWSVTNMRARKYTHL